MFEGGQLSFQEIIGLLKSMDHEASKVRDKSSKRRERCTLTMTMQIFWIGKYDIPFQLNHIDLVEIFIKNFIYLGRKSTKGSF